MSKHLRRPVMATQRGGLAGHRKSRPISHSHSTNRFPFSTGPHALRPSRFRITSKLPPSIQLAVQKFRYGQGSINIGALAQSTASFGRQHPARLLRAPLDIRDIPVLCLGRPSLISLMPSLLRTSFLSLFNTRFGLHTLHCSTRPSRSYASLRQQM